MMTMMNVKGRWGQGSIGGRKKRILKRKRMEERYIYICGQHNRTHQTLFEKGEGGEVWEYNRGAELVQNTLYTSMELSQ
jgi:hypothetical protein